MVNKGKKHMEILEHLNEVYIKKNSDYGDSFSKARKDVPNYTLGKLYDKFERFKNLTLNGNQQVDDEAIEDTLLDMANYAIMEVMEIKLENEEAFGWDLSIDYDDVDSADEDEIDVEDGELKFKVGDMVQNEYGSIGRILEVDESDVPYKVRYDKPGATIWEEECSLKLFVEDDNEGDELLFKVGDKVKYVESGSRMNGFIGEIKSLRTYDYVVEFEGWDGGHDGDFGDYEESRWFCEQYCLELL